MIMVSSVIRTGEKPGTEALAGPVQLKDRNVSEPVRNRQKTAFEPDESRNGLCGERTAAQECVRGKENGA